MSVINEIAKEIKGPLLPSNMRNMNFAALSLFMAQMVRIVWPGSAADGRSVMGYIIDIIGLLSSIMLFYGWLRASRYWQQRGLWLSAGYWLFAAILNMQSILRRPEMYSIATITALAFANLAIGSWYYMSKDHNA